MQYVRHIRRTPYESAAAQMPHNAADPAERTLFAEPN